MEEGNIKKTAFRASSMGLYEFTCMPFGLSNVGSSFCHLMEQCLGDQQFVTLLLYLNDICIFAPTIDDMLDQIELVFDRLKQFNLKIKPKNVNSLILVYSFWVMFYQPMVFLLTQKKWKRWKLACTSKHQGGSILFGASLILQVVHQQICWEGMMPSWACGSNI